MSHRVFQVLQAVPGGLDWQQEPPSPPGLCPETGSAAGESEEGAAGHRDVAASEEGSEQLSSASGGRAAPPRLEHVPGTAVGCVLSRYGSGMCPCLPLPRLLFLLHLWLECGGSQSFFPTYSFLSLDPVSSQTAQDREGCAGV